ncbi:hypothetical protein BST61_g9303 [Cercospora zeina]
MGRLVPISPPAPGSARVLPSNLQLPILVLTSDQACVDHVAIFAHESLPSFEVRSDGCSDSSQTPARSPSIHNLIPKALPGRCL